MVVVSGRSLADAASAAAGGGQWGAGVWQVPTHQWVATNGNCMPPTDAVGGKVVSGDHP